MKEWFYVKNDLKAREDVKDIIMRPIWQRFGLRKPKVEIDDAAEECQKAFGIVCSFIGTRDLVHEHIAFRVWPLVEQWEMPKETISKPDEGGLVRLKYTFRYEGKFIEPDDDWLKCIERLNRVFDAIGFMYPDYRYPLKGQKRKSTTSGKGDASVALSEATPKRKRVKVLTHRPRFIEPALVPKFGGETSTATESKEPSLTRKNEDLAMLPKADNIKEIEVAKTKIVEVTSPPAEMTVLKTQKDLTATPKRKRMVNVLDVLETIKSSSSTLKKIAEVPKAQIETTASEAEATKHQAETEAGPSEPAKGKSLETIGEETEAAEQILAEETSTATPEAFSEALNYILRHASGENLTEKEEQEAQFYAQKLKYLKGALIFNGSGEEDFLYCLPDSKEISICLEMGRSFGFPTLENGLSVLSKDELADSLAYNSLKVRE
jgi:hypothetical protein